MKILVVITLSLFFSYFNCYSQSNLISIELPDSITTNREFINDSLHSFRLKRLIHEHEKTLITQTESKEDLKYLDYIVNFTKNGVPIKNEENSIKKSLIENDLVFTYNSPDCPWTQQELDSLKSWVGFFYPIIKEIFGPPFQSSTIDIRKDTISDFAAYYAGTFIGIRVHNSSLFTINSIPALIHEMVHAFKGSYDIYYTHYSEGFTRAVENAVYERRNKSMPASVVDNNYSYNVYYEFHNNYKIAAKRMSLISFNLLRYQLPGYTLFKAYIEDNEFFKKFNSKYLEEFQKDESTRWDPDKIRNIFRSVKPKVEDIDFDLWYDKQYALNMGLPISFGRVFYIRAFYCGNYFKRERSQQEVIPFGYTDLELPIVNSALETNFYDYNDNLLSTQYYTTSNYGAIFFDMNFDGNYTGKVKLITEFNNIAIDTSYLHQGSSNGVFGIVEQENRGIVKIQNLNAPEIIDSVYIDNGAFYFKDFRKQRGTFQISFQSESGLKTSKTFTKDSCAYYIILLPRSKVLTSINDGEKITDFNLSVYPNPFTNELIIEFKDPTKDTEYEIFNSLGQIVSRGTIQERTVVPTTLLAPGFYLIRLRSGGKYEVRKIIKNESL